MPGSVEPRDHAIDREQSHCNTCARDGGACVANGHTLQHADGHVGLTKVDPANGTASKQAIQQRRGGSRVENGVV
eukprot:5048398-Prymnesium_polylepis.2